MIEVAKLNQLSPGQKRRKLALCFSSLERSFLGTEENGFELNFKNISKTDYIKALAKLVIDDPKTSPQGKQKLISLLQQEPIDTRRVCNYAKNELLCIVGAFPAEWDLVIAPHKSMGTTEKRQFFKGVYLYLDDIRSPFNLGSIFRTAEAMGVDTLFLSPLCVPPSHPRCKRSSMGTTETLPYKRIDFFDLKKTLPNDFPIFALETGGKDLQNFPFPKQGLCVVGNEELGISPDILNVLENKIATISLVGLKASLNVGVATGILLAKWTASFGL